MKTLVGNPQINDQRFGIFGLYGSGKTTVLGCLHATCVDYANSHPNQFYFRVDEKTSGIRQAPSDLRRGHFPPQTPPNHLFEADFIMRRKQRLNTQTIKLPFVETAGEEIKKLIERFGQGMYALDANSFVHAQSIQENILNVDGCGIIAPVDRAQVLGDHGLDNEPDQVAKDPDVNICRLLDCIYTYKQNMGAPPLKGIAVFLTKSDKLMQVLSASGINLATQEGIRTFMTTYFPETYSLLNFHGIEKVRFWPVWVQLELDKNRQPIRWEDGSEHIAIDARHRTPIYSRPAYQEFIEWIFQAMT